MNAVSLDGKYKNEKITMLMGDIDEDGDCYDCKIIGYQITQKELKK